MNCNCTTINIIIPLLREFRGCVSFGISLWHIAQKNIMKEYLVAQIILLLHKHFQFFQFF